MTRLRTLAGPLAGIVVLTAAVALVYGDARLLNYDTAYSLLWGSEYAAGTIPDTGSSAVPTQHPLATLFGLLLTLPGLGEPPYGQTATAAWEITGLFLLGLLGWLVYALGKVWFGAAAGVAAAAIVLTREPVLSYGVRAYVDIPYICFVLAALLVEARRPRAGTPVLALLALAGLLRPEAWLFTLAYLLWLRHHDALRPSHFTVAALGPGIWALTDLIQAGSPIASFTGTHEAADQLGRVTGIANVPETLPRRLGEILREPGLLAAAGGGLLAWLNLRDRARLPAVAVLLALSAFIMLAAAGLPILTRYLMLPAALLAVFAGAGLLGWTALDRSDPWRRTWAAFSGLSALLFVLFAAGQVDRLDRTRSALEGQRAILTELSGLSPGAIGDCPAWVPNRRAVPQLALWTGRPADAVRSAQDDRRYGLPAFWPASAETTRRFVLNPRDADRHLPPPPEGEPRTTGRWWVLTGTCP